MALLALAVFGCSARTPSHASAPPAREAQRVVLTAPEATRALPLRDHIALLATTRAPSALQIDGQLDEWGLFAAGQPTALTPSFVVISAAPDGLRLAGRVRALPPQGLWLTLQTEAPELPPIGVYQRGGGIMPLQCEAPEEPGGYMVDPESCHRLLEAYDELQKAHIAQFARQLRLSTQGVSRRVGEQEPLLAEARVAFQERDGAVAFEVALPLSALPRVATPELSSLRLELERADAAPPSEATRAVGLEPPLRFGIDSDLLNCALQTSAMAMPMMPRFSYQPGVPNRVYRTEHSGSLALEVRDVPLSRREANLGALEVRAVEGAWPMLAIIKDQQLVECTGVGNVLGVVERGRGLHVIGFTHEQDESVGLETAEFKVLEIEKDGTLHDDLLEPPASGFGYTAVGEEHAKNFSSFSIRGLAATDDWTAQQQHTLSWRYDRRLNRYAFSQKDGPRVARQMPE